MLVMLGLAARTLPWEISADSPGDAQPPALRGDGERESDMRFVLSTTRGVAGWRVLLLLVGEAPLVK